MTPKNTLPSPETGPEEETQHPRLKPVLVLRQQKSLSSSQVTFEVRKRLSCQGTKVHQIASLLPTHSHEIKAKFFLDAFCCPPSLYRLHCPEHLELSHASKRFEKSGHIFESSAFKLRLQARPKHQPRCQDFTASEVKSLLQEHFA